MFQFYSSLVYMSRLLLHTCSLVFQEASIFKNTKPHKGTQSQDVTKANSKKGWHCNKNITHTNHKLVGLRT
jgi:hypothetical protein